MKKILFLLLAVFLVVGCSDQIDITGPNGNNNNNNNNQNSENPNAIEFTYYGNVNYNGPRAVDPVLISSEMSGSSLVSHYKLSWDACPVNPNDIKALLGWIRLGIPHVINTDATVYYNAPSNATYSFEGADANFIYFKIVSLPNQHLKMNIAIKTTNNSAWNSSTCKWFYHIYPDDGVNNMYPILIGSKSAETENNTTIPAPRNDAMIPVQKSRDR